MPDPIQMLTREHRIIEGVLGSLETFVEHLSGGEKDRGTIRRFVAFFSQYVDRNHHGKEERYLFVRLADHGFTKESAISAMLSEQGEGREHLDAMSRIASGEGPLSPEERDLLRGHAQGYIVRILLHMKREDSILFPRIAQALPKIVLEQLGQQFEEFEKRELTLPLLETLHTTARSLACEYPPDRERLAELPAANPQ